MDTPDKYQGSPKKFLLKIKMSSGGPFHLILNLSRRWWQWHFGFWIFAPKCQPFSDCSALKAPSTLHFYFDQELFLGHPVKTSAATQLLHLSPVKADKGSQTPIRRTGSFFQFIQLQVLKIQPTTYFTSSSLFVT